MSVSFEVTEELELGRSAPIPTRGHKDQFRTGAGALLLVVAFTMAVFTGPLFLGSATAGASTKITTTRSVTSRVIRAPIGYMESSGSGVTNGPVSRAAFDQWIGTGSSAAYGYVGGYDVTYNNTATSESIEVTLFSFHSHADAEAFGSVAPGRLGGVQPHAGDEDHSSHPRFRRRDWHQGRERWLLSRGCHRHEGRHGDDRRVRELVEAEWNPKAPGVRGGFAVFTALAKQRLRLRSRTRETGPLAVWGVHCLAGQV